jgi:NhaP-type Na+/H+ or K+/H+ antiporter
MSDEVLQAKAGIDFGPASLENEYGEARTSDALMLRDGLRPAIFGLVLGLIASAGIARLIQSCSYRTPAVDPVVYLLVSATLPSVAVLACTVPA